VSDRNTCTGISNNIVCILLDLLLDILVFECLLFILACRLFLYAKPFSPPSLVLIYLSEVFVRVRVERVCCIDVNAIAVEACNYSYNDGR